MTDPRSMNYLEFLEQEFSQSPPPEHVRRPPDPDTVQRSTEELRWSHAASLLQPRSRFGFLFGVTGHDINHAAALLAGAPEFRLSGRAAKRVVDVAISLALLIFLLPLIVCIPIGIKFGSRGPVLVGHTRVGKYGHHFRMLKFRTMNADPIQMRASLTDGVDGAGSLFKMRDDPRVTRFGRILRRLSLDELPQLWNVLRGDMSLVGPRPPLPLEVETYDAYAGRFLLIRPGLTGLWQLSSKADLTWAESVRLDLRYVANWSFRLDVLILVLTIRAVRAPN